MECPASPAPGSGLLERSMSTRKAESADVALVLEGTFPYVSGGVSSWINQIIRAYPEIRFAIVFLGSRREDYKEFKYQLPDNVVHFEEHYLYENLNANYQPAKRDGDPQAFKLIDQLIDALHQGPDHPQTMEVFRQVALEMRPGGKLRLEDFLYSQRAWKIICSVYRDHCSDPSFVDFFWTVRIMFQPLWLLARVASELIPVRVTHALPPATRVFSAACWSRPAARRWCCPSTASTPRNARSTCSRASGSATTATSSSATRQSCRTFAKCGSTSSSGWGATAMPRPIPSLPCTKPTACARWPMAPRRSAPSTSPTASRWRVLRRCAHSAQPRRHRCCA